MAGTQKRRVRSHAKYTIPTNWDVVEWPPFRLEGNWLVTERESAPRARSATTSGRRSRLHRQLANAVDKKGKEVTLKDNWRQLALAFANGYFPPVADCKVSPGLRVPVARFGEESLLVWWMLRLGSELARGPEGGNLDATLRSAFQVWSLLPDHSRPSLPGLSSLQYDARSWIGLFAATLPKARQRDEGLTGYVQRLQAGDRSPDEVRSLSFSESSALAQSLRSYHERRSARASQDSEENLKQRAARILDSLLAARYGRSVRRLMLGGPHRGDGRSSSLDELNARIRSDSKRLLGRSHLGVLRIGSQGTDPEQTLWDLAARVFASTLNGRMTGSVLTCLVQPVYGDVARLTPGLRFMTPRARIWFDFWKDLGPMLEVGSCEVCGDPLAARTRTHRFCCTRCRKTAEMRRWRQ